MIHELHHHFHVCVYYSSDMFVGITEADFQQRENQGNNFITVRVSYNLDLVNNITINFNPVTYDQYLNVLSLVLPPDFPSIARPTGPEYEAQGNKLNATFIM